MLPSLPSWLPSWRQAVLLLTPFVLAPLATMGVEGRCAYVILIMDIYWMTEVVPIPVTALIPLFAFPLLGVLSTAELCLMYMKETNMMFLSGLTVAIAVEHCGLHNRIALLVVLTVGHSPRRLMTGFMLTTMFLSMWISNTAATAMMVPVVDAVLQELYKTRTNCHAGSQLADTNRVVAPHHQSRDPIVEKNGDDVLMTKYQQKKGSFSSTVSLNMEEGKPAPESPPPAQSETSVMFAPPPNEECRKLRDMCYLATVYSATLGGTGSLTGSGSNLVMKAAMDEFFPATNVLNFATWLLYNVPGMVICVGLTWFWLQLLFVGFRSDGVLDSDPERDASVRKVLQRKYSALGRTSFHELVVLVLFCSLVLLWLFRSPGFMTGWADAFRYIFPNVIIRDTTPAMLIVFLLFVIPRKPRFLSFFKSDSEDKDKDKDADLPCLTWKVVQSKFSWGTLLLLGGGFAMAEAADKSNMSALIGEQMRALEALPREAIVLLTSLLAGAVTQVASNAAAASMLLPVLKELALGIKVNPLYMMLPANLCCSFAFMLPVSTPGNAIVLGATNMKIMTMVKAGTVTTVICVCVTTLMINTYGKFFFDLDTFPDWANETMLRGNFE